MSRGALTTTSYAVLGLLSVRPWSTYEITQQMSRSLGRIWPRAASKLYEEPKKLVAHRLARATEELVGQRPRTLYTITAKGRRQLVHWLSEPGDGPVLEFEGLLKIFFGEHATRDDTLATLAATQAWARARGAESRVVGEQYLAGTGPYPQRLAVLALVSRFLVDFDALVGSWARWASEIVATWPDDAHQARADMAVIAETMRRAAAAAEQPIL